MLSNVFSPLLQALELGLQEIHEPQQCALVFPSVRLLERFLITDHGSSWDIFLMHTWQKLEWWRPCLQSLWETLAYWVKVRAYPQRPFFMLHKKKLRPVGRSVGESSQRVKAHAAGLTVWLGTLRSTGQERRTDPASDLHMYAAAHKVDKGVSFKMS